VDGARDQLLAHPLSPVISTLLGVRAAIVICSRTARIASLSPIRVPPAGRSCSARGIEPILPDRLAVLEQAPHALLEVFDLERLLQKSHAPPRSALIAVSRAAYAVITMTDARRIEEARALEHFEPVHTGHDNVW